MLGLLTGLPAIYSEFQRAEFPLLGILKDIILDDECKTCFVKQTSVTSSTGQQTQHVGSVGYKQIIFQYT
jgi:hypothetical protein